MTVTADDIACHVEDAINVIDGFIEVLREMRDELKVSLDNMDYVLMEHALGGRKLCGTCGE